MLAVMGTGFRPLLFIDADLARALEGAEDVTIALDLFQRQMARGYNLIDIVNVANETQHKLLSTTIAPFAETTANICLREICHCAALIYNDMVVFPLPATTGTKPRLSKRLRFAIENYEVLSSKSTTMAGKGAKTVDHSDLILWALMLGAMAASLTVHTTWYVQKLGQYLSQSPYRHTWLDFRKLMFTFLWWSYIFDEPGQRLWWEGHLASELHDSTDVDFHRPKYAICPADHCY